MSTYENIQNAIAANDPAAVRQALVIGPPVLPFDLDDLLEIAIVTRGSRGPGIARLLIAAGADPRAASADARHALVDVAAAYGTWPMFELLTQHVDEAQAQALLDVARSHGNLALLAGLETHVSVMEGLQQFRNASPANLATGTTLLDHWCDPDRREAGRVTLFAPTTLPDLPLLQSMGIRSLALTQPNFPEFPRLPEGLKVLAVNRLRGASSLGNLPDSLDKLEFVACEQLEQVRDWPSNLKELWLIACPRLQQLPPLPSSLMMLTCINSPQLEAQVLDVQAAINSRRRAGAASSSSPAALAPPRERAPRRPHRVQVERDILISPFSSHLDVLTAAADRNVEGQHVALQERGEALDALRAWNFAAAEVSSTFFSTHDAVATTQTTFRDRCDETMVFFTGLRQDPGLAMGRHAQRTARGESLQALSAHPAPPSSAAPAQAPSQTAQRSAEAQP